MKNARTKALEFSPEARERIVKRDSIDGYPCCVVSGRTDNLQIAHYIPRSQGGMGVEENGVVLNADIHRDYDNGQARELIGRKIKIYLMGHYPGWDESRLIYQKYPEEMRYDGRTSESV